MPRSVTVVTVIFASFDEESIHTPGFWIKEASYREQPVVQFQQQAIVQLLDAASGTHITWSTFAAYNRVAQSTLRTPVVKVRHMNHVRVAAPSWQTVAGDRRQPRWRQRCAGCDADISAAA